MNLAPLSKKLKLCLCLLIDMRCCDPKIWIKIGNIFTKLFTRVQTAHLWFFFFFLLPYARFFLAPSSSYSALHARRGYLFWGLKYDDHHYSTQTAEPEQDRKNERGLICIYIHTHDRVILAYTKTYGRHPNNGSFTNKDEWLWSEHPRKKKKKSHSSSVRHRRVLEMFNVSFAAFVLEKRERHLGERKNNSADWCFSLLSFY